jgi:hypothetical protein
VAPPSNGLASLPSSNSPDHNAKGTQSGARTAEAARRPPTACKHVVSGSLSLPAQGCFSPVPHGTRSLSVTRESLALEGGPPSFTPDYSGRALLRNSTTTRIWRRVPGSHRLWRPVPGDFCCLRVSRPWVLQPRGARRLHGLGCSRFARRYFGNLG